MYATLYHYDYDIPEEGYSVVSVCDDEGNLLSWGEDDEYSPSALIQAF